MNPARSQPKISIGVNSAPAEGAWVQQGRWTSHLPPSGRRLHGSQLGHMQRCLTCCACKPVMSLSGPAQMPCMPKPLLCSCLMGLLDAGHHLLLLPAQSDNVSRLVMVPGIVTAASKPKARSSLPLQVALPMKVRPFHS